MALASFLPAFRREEDGGRVAVGLNLDKRCTDSLPTATCTLPNGAFVADLDGGVDLAALRIFDFLVSLESLSSDGGPSVYITPATIDTKVREGQFGLIIEVARYNGAETDGDVTVALYPAVVRTNPPAGTSSSSPDARWALDERGRVVTNKTALPRYSDAFGYVTGGVLVARIDELQMDLSVDETAPFPLKLTDVRLRAKLEPDPSSPDATKLRLKDGLLAGRWDANEFLASLGRVPVNNKPLCDEPFFKSALDLVCDSRDLTAGASTDGTGAPCTAMSISFSFDTYGIASRYDYGSPRDAGSLRCSDPATFSCK